MNLHLYLCIGTAVKSTYFKTSLLGVFLASISSLCLADLVDRPPDSPFWNWNVTLDTETNLEWLDLRATLNMSVNETLTALAPGGDYFGFRYATRSEINQLQANAGSLDGIGNSSDVAVVSNTLVLLGFISGEPANITIPNPWVLNGFFDWNDAGLAKGDFRIMRYQDSNPTFVSFHDALNQFGASGGDTATITLGSFLVRDTAPVPLPSAFLLLASGFGLISWRRAIAARG